MVEGKTRVVTKADVAMAKASLVARNEYPSTPKIRKELADTIKHSGHQNQIWKWLQELRDEEEAAKHDDKPLMPSEPLPLEIQEVLDTAQATIATGFATLCTRLAATLTTTQAAIRKNADEYITSAMAGAERRAEEAGIEAADSRTEIERLDLEIESLQTLLEQHAAAVLPLKETLVLAQTRVSTLEAERETAGKERLAALGKTEEIAGELATTREKIAMITSERDHGERLAAQLQAQLEAASERIGLLTTELSDVKQLRAELTGENRRLISERDHYREAATAERARAEQALEEAHTAKTEIAKLLSRKVAKSGKRTGASGAAPAS